MKKQKTDKIKEAVDMKRDYLGTERYTAKVAGTKKGFWVAEIETTFNPNDDGQGYNYQAMYRQTKIGPEFEGYGGFDQAENEIAMEQAWRGSKEVK